MSDGYYERRYTGKYGRVAHLTRPSQREHAVCGVWAAYGTGSQGEYERASELPVCKSCQQLGYLRSVPPPPGCACAWMERADGTIANVFTSRRCPTHGTHGKG